MTSYDILTLVIILFLLIYIVYADLRNYCERKQLLNRLMAKDYGEYSHHEIRKEQLKQTEDDEYVSL